MGTRRRRGTTGRDLVAFWHTAAQVGFIPENTALSLRSACARVLAVYPDWRTLDVTRLDVEQTLGDFTRLHEHRLSGSTLQAYRSRFRRAVADFLRDARGPGTRRPVEPEDEAEPEAADFDPRPAAGRTGHPALRERFDEIVKYDLALAGGRVARLVLPIDLTHADVARLLGFLRTIPLDQEDAAG
ncbi:hypothetical protein [Rhizohabitans arisaemae]|uniref:hypothetical protein n=1 Tax=Rhizohabitans arisaemae TaxID=2720610 RepID=UPI0024B1BF24|nr:hypothetical protein [Rhizohabitans arisaemae]